MTMTVTIDDRFIARFESFIASLPKGAVKMEGVLDDEIIKRVAQYKSNQMKTTPFMDGLDSIRERLTSQL